MLGGVTGMVGTTTPYMQKHVVKGLIPETTMWKNTLDTTWIFNTTGIHHIEV